MLKKLYEKNETLFAVAWIISYCMLASIGDNLSKSIGILKICSLPILLVLSAIMLIFVKKNQLHIKYGLCKSKISTSKMLYYIPLIVLMTVNLWNGFSLNGTPLEIVLFILSMFCVGFLEEMIFRGFLFNAMVEGGVKSATIVSSVTFGLGHIMNLINGSGAELLPNLLQVIYAIAIGYTFVMIYCRTTSLIPCIITHGIFNAMGAFANRISLTAQKRIITSSLIAIVAIGYALYITFAVEDKKE